MCVAISSIIVGAGSGWAEGDIFQRAGVSFEHFWHCRGALAMALPGSRWSVGLPSRDNILSIIRLRVVSRAIIGPTSVDITEKMFLLAMPFSRSFVVM